MLFVLELNAQIIRHYLRYDMLVCVPVSNIIIITFIAASITDDHQRLCGGFAVHHHFDNGFPANGRAGLARKHTLHGEKEKTKKTAMI